MSKITSLFHYVVPAAVLFVYYPITFLLSKSPMLTQQALSRERLPKLWMYFLILLVINVGLQIANEERTALVGLLSFLWLILLMWLPLTFVIKRKWAIPRWLTSRMKWFWGIAICIFSLQYLVVFVPLIFNPMVIGQDYVNVAERTILNNGKVVDNLDYINSHQINGLQLYDPRKSTAGTLLKVKDCQGLYQALIARDRANRSQYDCDAKKSTLILKTAFVSVDEKNLSVLRRRAPASAEENDFIQRNTLNDSEALTYKGYFLYHHGYNFGPMNALSLGATPVAQTMVYGWLSTVMQGKVLESLGMMSYQGYFKVFFSTYIAYFVVFLLGIWLIYKDLGTLVFAGVLAVSAILVLGIELIKLAPGFNPVRHFFDVPVFYLLYRYLSDKRITYLFAATALSLFAVIWSKDLGMFLATSVGGALIVHGIRQRPFSRLPLLIGLITATAAILLYFSPLPGTNPTSFYMLLGVNSPLATSSQIVNLLMLVIALLLATLWVKQNSTYTILTLGMALYFVQGLTYYVWYPELHHLLGVAPVFILWLVALYHGWSLQCQDVDKTTNRRLLVFFSIVLLIYLPASIHFVKERKEYLHQYANHQLYQWSFESGQFESTMDPSLFEEAVDLIGKHSSNNGIYIISKYDHVLPILAGRYSAMPYNELLTNLVSRKEADIAAKTILENNPKYLFVDSDIGNGFSDHASPTETANISAQLAAMQARKLYGDAASRERLVVGLYDVFLVVADKYEKCETGGLISVYCRRDN